jgi:hypothetical protein
MCPAALSQTTIVPTISGNELTARIDLPGGLGADLTISFEQVVGLNPSALAITASVVSVTDPALLSRLPGSTVGIPTGFPVVVKIEPVAGSGFSFSGVYKLALHTHNLTFQANSPLRLYRSASGGPFKDMTGFLQMGSVRAGGSGPGFSEFLIVADVRPVDAVIAEKLANLRQTLNDNAAKMPASVFGDLSSRLDQIGTLIASGAVNPATDAVQAFAAQVKAQSGATIPDVWQATGGANGVVNVAGLLRAGADTLRYSLVFKSNL